MIDASDVSRDGVAGDRRESQLVRELKTRSQGAWAELFSDHYDRLRRYVRLRVATEDDADDISAGVFLRALGGIDSFKYDGKPVVAWLYGIARNLIRERLRTERRQAQIVGAEFDLSAIGHNSSDGIDGHSELLDLQSALTRLTRLQQEVVLLLHVSGFRAKEVAAMMGKSERAIYYLDARGLTRLKQDLTQGVLSEGAQNE